MLSTPFPSIFKPEPTFIPPNVVSEAIFKSSNPLSSSQSSVILDLNNVSISEESKPGNVLAYETHSFILISSILLRPLCIIASVEWSPKSDIIVGIVFLFLNFILPDEISILCLSPNHNELSERNKCLTLYSAEPISYEAFDDGNKCPI